MSVLMIERIIKVDKMEHIINLFGNYDEHLNLLQKQFNVMILNRGTDLKITGADRNNFV